jgi:hypothetical protein
MPSNSPTPRLPRLTEDLVTALDYFFPDRSPSPDTPISHVWYAAGAASVVRFLRGKLEEQRRECEDDLFL